MFKNNLKFTRTACWINSKISNRGSNTTFMIFMYCHCCCSLLWGSYWRSLMLWNSTSWSYLKLTVQIQLALHPCDPFVITNCSMTDISVKNYCFVVLNVKLLGKLRFKMFCWLLKLLYIALTLNTTTNTACFAYSSKKCVVYGPELNL